MIPNDEDSNRNYNVGEHQFRYIFTDLSKTVRENIKVPW